MVKRDGVILEKIPHYGKRKTGVVSKESLWQGKKDGVRFRTVLCKEL